MSRRCFVSLGLLLLFLITTCGYARTWVVRPDGSGDVPTIEIAIDSFSSGDVIELDDGIYTGDGNRDLTNQEKSVVIRSQSGNPTTCIIDCQGTENDPHGFIAFWGGG